MNYFEEETETVINNEYDYSNIIPTIENITYIVKYCDKIYNQFVKLVEGDENKNEKLRYDLQNYKYKKSYSEEFEVKIRNNLYNSITCKGYDSFVEAMNNKRIVNVESLEIKLNLSYKRGKIDTLSEHENSFSIVFRPYKVIFSRKSNHNEADMNQIENNINEILKIFPAVNTIFCSK